MSKKEEVKLPTLEEENKNLKEKLEKAYADLRSVRDESYEMLRFKKIVSVLIDDKFISGSAKATRLISKQFDINDAITVGVSESDYISSLLSTVYGWDLQTALEFVAYKLGHSKTIAYEIEKHSGPHNRRKLIAGGISLKEAYEQYDFSKKNLLFGGISLIKDRDDNIIGVVISVFEPFLDGEPEYLKDEVYREFTGLDKKKFEDGKAL